MGSISHPVHQILHQGRHIACVNWRGENHTIGILRFLNQGRPDVLEGTLLLAPRLAHIAAMAGLQIYLAEEPFFKVQFGVLLHLSLDLLNDMKSMPFAGAPDDCQDFHAKTSKFSKSRICC